METDRAFSDDAEAINKLGEEVFAGVNAGGLDRPRATMDPRCNSHASRLPAHRR
jgi:hypothetical protein